MTISTGNFGKALKEGRNVADKDKKKEKKMVKGPYRGYYMTPEDQPRNPSSTLRTKKDRKRTKSHGYRRNNY